MDGHFGVGIDSLSVTAWRSVYHLIDLKGVRPFTIIERYVNPTGRICSRQKAIDKQLFPNKPLLRMADSHHTLKSLVNNAPFRPSSDHIYY